MDQDALVVLGTTSILFWPISSETKPTPNTEWVRTSSSQKTSSGPQARGVLFFFVNDLFPGRFGLISFFRLAVHSARRRLRREADGKRERRHTYCSGHDEFLRRSGLRPCGCRFYTGHRKPRFPPDIIGFIIEHREVHHYRFGLKVG